MNMARKKTGALIAIQGTSDLTPYQHAGERFLAAVNARLIETIFFKDSPPARRRYDHRWREDLRCRLYPPP